MDVRLSFPEFRYQDWRSWQKLIRVKTYSLFQFFSTRLPCSIDCPDLYIIQDDSLLYWRPVLCINYIAFHQFAILVSLELTFETFDSHMKCLWRNDSIPGSHCCDGRRFWQETERFLNYVFSFGNKYNFVNAACVKKFLRFPSLKHINNHTKIDILLYNSLF